MGRKGVPGYVQELYDDKIKRYHLNDMKTYCIRSEPTNNTIMERGAMLFPGFPGQRAVDLLSPAYFS